MHAVVTVTGAWSQLAANPSVRVANAVCRPWRHEFFSRIRPEAWWVL
jgi:hypothetical protein